MISGVAVALAAARFVATMQLSFSILAALTAAALVLSLRTPRGV